MKKTRFLLIFLLFILRGPFLFAQSLELTTTYVKTDSNFCNLLYRITATATGGVSPYTFRLYNAGVTNSSGIFNNLPSNNYTVEVTDASGQKKSAYVLLPPNPYISAFFSAIATLCDSNGFGLYRLIGSGGQPPYSFKVDSVPSSTNAFRLLPYKYYNVTVTDAAGYSWV